MEDVKVVERDTRYEYQDYPDGIPESRPLDFHSPYGCSKGAADQYVRDYTRIYGLPAVVFRMSCIYGPRQFGTEDQGWLAHFMISALRQHPINIYGDGKQVRDILFIDDLVRAFKLAVEHINTTSGEVFNIGGGPSNTISVWAEFGNLLSRLHGQDIPVSYGYWRPGDQLCYISDIRKAQRLMGWQPQVEKEKGISRLWEWLSSEKGLFHVLEPAGVAQQQKV
jgi:CDP-paratose 2-epimerase